MSAPQGHTLPKEERLCGKTTVSALISDGKWGATAHLRYCWAAGRDTGLNRLMVAVPKKFFKRAVKRNLLKRRMREAYRLQKELLAGTGIDLMLSYSHAEIADFATLYAEVADILNRVSRHPGSDNSHSGPACSHSGLDPESPVIPSAVEESPVIPSAVEESPVIPSAVEESPAI